MARTNPGAVQKLLGADYDTVTEPSLEPYVDTAYSVVTRLAAKAAAAVPAVAFSDSDKELVERWLAAHYYTKSDRVYSSKSTLGRSASFVLDPKVPEPYKAGALDADPTGLLAGLLDPSKRATAWWGGRRPSAQTPYRDRT